MITIRGWGEPYELKCYRCGLTLPVTRTAAAEASGNAVCPNCRAPNYRPIERSRRSEVTIVVALAFVGVLAMSMLAETCS
jgi:hypothetical protein